MKRSVHHALTLALLLAAVPAVYSQEPSGAGAEPPAASSANAADANAPGSKASDASRSQNGSSPKSPVVCFKLTMNCIGGDSGKNTNGTQPNGARARQSAGSRDTGSSRNSGAGPSDTASSKSDGSHQTLNLTPPDVRTVIPEEELEEPLPTPDQEAIAEEQETVEVKTENERPVVLGGFAALWWAMNHPSQAWRIFTPIE